MILGAPRRYALLALFAGILASRHFAWRWKLEADFCAGFVVGVGCVMQDVTEQRIAELARDHLQDAEERVAQYVLREHSRGRALDEILADHFVENRLETPEQRARLLDGDFAVLLEPTDGWVEAGCQGVLVARAGFDGERAHAARPWIRIAPTTTSR